MEIVLSYLLPEQDKSGQNAHGRGRLLSRSISCEIFEHPDCKPISQAFVFIPVLFTPQKWRPIQNPRMNTMTADYLAQARQLLYLLLRWEALVLCCVIYNDTVNVTNRENKDRQTDGFAIGGCGSNGERYQTDRWRRLPYCWGRGIYVCCSRFILNQFLCNNTWILTFTNEWHIVLQTKTSIGTD